MAGYLPGCFTEEEIQCLEENAIFPPDPHRSQGKRKISATLIASTPSSNTSISSSASTTSVRTWNFNPSTISTNIPTDKESIEVLEYIGFEPATALDIFQRYTSRPEPDDCPDDLLSYVHGQISDLKGETSHEALARVGINTQIQSAIADPMFSDILWTRDLHFWVKDTLDTNLASLRNQHGLIKRHAGRLIAHKNKRKRRRVQGSFSTEEESTEQIHQPVATINMTSEDFHLPPTCTTIVDGDIPLLPDHIALYKGKAHGEMRSSRQLISSDGTINLSSLYSPPGGDFNSMGNAQYWTPDKEIAEKYRQWTALRCPQSDTCLLTIQVPKEFIETLDIIEIWFSGHWKELVWHCRQQLHLSAQFNSTYEVDLIKGHICAGQTEDLTQITANNIHTFITRDKLLQSRSTGKPGIQWAFQCPASIIRLQEQISGKMHLDIFAATN
ncbi:hypothetical protein N7478_002192 [Penicillium angulare]|uniref:uncharacterized protein n=1 Tax=Penicillium angulare TaxID=116970 RepID=UPI0025400459|nr:uncharacterized protein N7478_002192 [Penicillium angulare]KAJ5289162.1 hypothetical protein N7478_002192 [Penicillium angulare]